MDLSGLHQPPSGPMGPSRSQQWMAMPLQDVHHWNERFFSLKGQKPLPHFLPGQHVEVGCEVAGEWLRRPFSLVNGVHEAFEIYVQALPCGRMSPALQKLKAGDTLKVSLEAKGRMVLAPQAQSLAWIGISTGTGLAPLLAQLSQIDLLKATCQEIILLQGLRWEGIWPYQAHLQKFAEAYGPRFQCVLCWTPSSQPFSLPSPLPFPWLHLFPGRVNACLESGALERYLSRPLDAELDQVMLCGKLAMARQGAFWLAQNRGFRKRAPQGSGGYLMEAYG